MRDSAFDVVQSLLNRIFAGHQEWTKTGVEPKAPVNPPKQPTSVIGVTGSYVSSAINWVSGSLLSKNDAATTKPVEDKNEPPKAVSSSNVNRVLPPTANMELSMEELEGLGKPSEKESLQRTESQKDEDMWGESTPAATNSTDWNSGWAEESETTETKKDPLMSMGGWDDTNLTFSDDNEEEKKDCIYELTSTVHAFVQESIQWTNQNKRIRLFDYLPDHLVSWLDSHPSSGRVSSPSITTSISYAWYD